jgi:hypothetical protein
MMIPGYLLKIAQTALLGSLLATSVASQAACSFDIDGNGSAELATDGVLLVRYLSGFRGDALTVNALGTGATRSATDIEAFISTQNFDLDGDNATLASTDGLLAARYMAGQTGTSLAFGALTTTASRYTGVDIAAFIARGCSTVSTVSCPQAAYFPDVSSRNSYVDKNLDGKTTWDVNSTLKPSVSVTCSGGVVSVASNGIPNFDSLGIGLGGTDANYQTYVKTWRFPQNPAIAVATTSITNKLGPVAIMVNGVQIYGPVEAPQDNFADPFKAGLLNYCGGHVFQFHFHSFPECFFNQKTLTGPTTFLPALTPGVVLGYAFDGFPILAPYEYCSDSADSTCVNGVREIKSAYRYTGSGNYTTEGAFAFNSYTAGYGGSALDACNGKTTNGSYAYYATRQFPYFIGCYRGAATTQ